MRIHHTTALGLLAFVASVGAQSTNQWSLRGPEGGYILSVEIDRVSGAPIAGGTSGIFRYDAGTAAWQYATAGSPSIFVQEIASVAPQGHAPATFVLSGGYVVRSDDGGLTWTNVNNVLMGGRVQSLAASTAAGQTRLYAGVQTSGLNATDGGVWYSTDLGATWTQNPQLAGSDVRLVRAASNNPNLLYAATFADANGVAALYRSSDGGLSFPSGPVAQTNGTAQFPVVFFDVAHAPAPSTEVTAVSAPDAAAFSDGVQGGQIFVSSDDGQTFTTNATAFFLTPETSGGGEPRGVMYDAAHPGTVYFATTWGVFRSVNGAAPVPVSSGLPQLGVRDSGAQPYDTVYHLAQSTDASHTLYAAMRSGGVQVSTDEAASWHAQNAGLTALNFRIFAFQPGNTGVVLAGSVDMNPDTIRGLAFSPPPNSNIVLATGFPQMNIGGETNKGAWRSTDGGQTWTPITDAGMRTYAGKRLIQFDPNDASRVLISVGGSMHLSTDGGATWVNSINQSALFGGLPTQVAGNLATLLGIAAGPGPVSGTRFYLAVEDGYFPNPPPAGAQGGVYYSDDGGYHWTFAGAGLPDDAASYFAVSPTAGTVFVTKPTNGSARQGGVFKSTDYGVTFSDVSATLPCRNVFTVAADPVDANVVWTACAADSATSPGGIFRSNDGGSTWVPYGRGLRVPGILWITIDPADPNHLLAGGYEGIHEMHFAPDADQDGIPDSEEAQFAGGDANNDGTQDAAQSYVASTGTSTPAALRPKVPLTSDYVVVEIDRTQPFTGTCDFVSDLSIVPVDQIPRSNRMQQAAPTIRLTLPSCSAARVRVRYSAIASYPVGVFGSYSPTVPGDGASTRWGLLAGDVASVDGSGTWTLALDENAYGNVYAPGSGSIQFQGAPGQDTIFGAGFE